MRRPYVEKGATEAPFYYGRGRRLPFLAGLLLPALGFLRHCLLSPPSCGIACESAPAHRSWLPPGTLTGVSALLASGHLPLVRKGELDRLRSSFTRDGDEFTILIPDVDFKLVRGSVKHNQQKKSKKSAAHDPFARLRA